MEVAIRTPTIPSCTIKGVSSAEDAERLARRPYEVLAHGLPYFCEKLARLFDGALWDVRWHSLQSPMGLPALVNDLRRCDLAYIWGGRISLGKFLWAARSLRKKKIVMFWCGSDVLAAKKELADGRMDPWVASRIHWAASPSLAHEVRSLGLSCEYVQASFVNRVVRPAPLPRKFAILVFMPTAARMELYGWDRVLEVARSLPSVEFTVVGLRDAGSLPAPPNVVIHHWIEDLTPFYERATVLWRPVRHDAGISFMVLEALARGRHVLYTYPIPGCIQVSETEGAKKELERLISLHRAGQLHLNHEGMRAVDQYYSIEAVRSELHRRWTEIILS